MTLIAITLSNRPPIITADILITSTHGEPELKLPNRPTPLKQEEVHHLNFKPSELLQKLYVIQPNICMCVAGRVYEIKLILEDFRNFCRLKSNEGKRWLTFEELKDFFTSYDQDTLKEVVLGIAVATDEQRGFVFTPDLHKQYWKGESSNDFGFVITAGSGAEQFLKHINWHHLVGSSHEPGDFMYAKHVNFSFITKFLAKENKTLKSLEDYWGGFLETCYFNGEKFEKVGKIVFVISDAVSDQNGNMTVPMPRLFIYSQYIDSVLYLTTVEATSFILSESKDSIEFFSKTFVKTLFIVKEIDFTNLPAALQQDDDLSFISTNIALGINVKINSQVNLPVSAYTEGEDVNVEFVDGDYIKFIWPVFLQEQHAAMVREIYPELQNAIDGRNPSDKATPY